jgi:hypothetical protein
MYSRTFVVIDIKRRYNRHRDEVFYAIEMLDDASGQLVKTYASEENYNFCNWKSVIDDWDPMSGQLLVLQGVFLFKRDHETRQLTNIVNADSTPRITECVDRDAYLAAYAQRYLADA